MNSTPTTRQVPPEDIDLLALAERTILFFRKYKWIFIIGIAGGLIAGYLTWRKLPTVYQSRMILHSFTLSNEDYIQVVDNFNNLLKRNERDQLAASFEIPRSDLGKVRQMKGYQIQRVFTASNPNGFYIDVYVTDNAVLPSLQKGILTGLENVDYIKKQVAIRKANLTRLISDVENEIAKLDSTKSTVERIMSGRGGASSSLIVDISGINRQLIDMKEKLLNYRQDLQFTTAVQVLQGFHPFHKPAGPKKVVWLGLGLVTGLAIAYIISLYLSIREKLKVRRAMATRK